ncbi:hypothetical protein K458DRAFT_287414 [Lentithecium fluviatile CBS 122367]|uniref:Amidohydrolase-related domain-containing protein n=1 Tax=Lentithecium fluviatile CBS 122367 TaxID=1168545 RepID=A0A6G1JL88_9PLEO|nr:hypothetical protein K458DRAFT_287414 [Lentithecium fluviatile CBS 122367]
MSPNTTPQAPFIAVSESYLIPANTSPTESAIGLIPAPTMTKLRNVGLPRIKDMRATGVTMQIVSHIPVHANPLSCAKINDALNAAIYVSPDRFAAMALLPALDAKEAARELQRCVTKYKFVGGVLGLREDVRVDDMDFEELWGIAETYRVPVALKEVWPTLDQTRDFRGYVPEALLGPLVANFNAARVSSPLPILQLYAAGVFDRHPNLRLIVSRSGLLIASLLPRIKSLFTTLPASQRPNRSFLDIWQHNFYISTEDVLDLGSMRALLEQIPMDRVMYGANYPFEEGGKALMAELKESGIVGREEWERIASGNAEALFGLGTAKGGKSTMGRSSY